ncbi:MAG TPA: DUF4389 domain-containing protein [bacterium]|nr:DUF4389 domain-containing protein [bacterium]
MTEPHETPPAEPTGGLPVPRPPSPWFRLPYLVLFVIVFEVVKLLVELIAVVQFILRVATGKPNERLHTFGAGLGRYVREITDYLTYASDATPYPFGPWPRE